MKHRETHLPNLDRAPDTQRALSAVLIRRRRASLDLEYQNLPEKRGLHPKSKQGATTPHETCALRPPRIRHAIKLR